MTNNFEHHQFLDSALKISKMNKFEITWDPITKVMNMIKLLECVILGFSLCLDISVHRYTFADPLSFPYEKSIHQSNNQALSLLILQDTTQSCQVTKQLNSKSMCVLRKCLSLCICVSVCVLAFLLQIVANPFFFSVQCLNICLIVLSLSHYKVISELLQLFQRSKQLHFTSCIAGISSEIF